MSGSSSDSTERSAPEEAVSNAAVHPETPAELVPIVQLLSNAVHRATGRSRDRKIARSIGVFGAVKTLSILFSMIKPILLPHMTSSVTFEAEQEVTQKIMNWIVKNSGPSSILRRHTKHTVTASQRKDERGLPRLEMAEVQSTSIDETFFFFKGRVLHFARKEAQTTGTGPRGFSNVSASVSGEEIKITALGSAWIIEELVREVEAIDEEGCDVTTVYTVAFEYGGWKPKQRMSRPMNTIEMDPAVKEDLVNDMQLFLSPARKKFYSNRGIPYHRGYLIFGSPGTGKSSFAFACAGLIGGGLYSASLSQFTNERIMVSLFEQVHSGSILLLEDVDSAGLTRETMESDENAIGLLGTRNQKVSLSGLLNAIDGLNDGVILMMTSNSPESLDRALIRPGRIDRQVFLGCIISELAENMFKRLYHDDEAGEGVVTPEIEQLAKNFSEVIPDGKITPAEVQGFLLQRTPQEAVEQAEQWVRDVVDAREAGLNIVGVNADDESMGIDLHQ